MRRKDAIYRMTVLPAVLLIVLAATLSSEPRFSQAQDGGTRAFLPAASFSATSQALQFDKGGECPTSGTVDLPSLSSALHILPPLGKSTGAMSDFDHSLTDYLTVTVCVVVSGDGCTPVATFTSEKINRGPDYIKLQYHHYHVNWQVSKADIGKAVEIRFAVAGLDVGLVGYTPNTNRVVPVKFQIDNHPQIRARVLHEQGYTATEIAQALVDEFDLQALETAWILAVQEGYSAVEVGQALKDVGFSVVEVGTALRDVLALDAQATAQILKDVGFSVVEVGTALRDVFCLDAQAAAQILKDVGFSAVEVGTALRDVFALEAQETAWILYDVEFSLVEISAALEDVYNLEEDYVHYVLAPILIEIFGPTVCFHPDELYLMSSVDWFLDGTTTLENDEGLRVAVSPSEVQNRAVELGCDGDAECWFRALAAKRPGRLDGAKAYVHVYHPDDHPEKFDLQFWLFYPYNGPGTLYSRIGELWDETSVIDPVGSHSGDWESVTIRFSDAYTLVEVYLSQHGNYPVTPIAQVERIPGTQHLKTYSSLNGHANYATAGNNADRKVHVDLGLGHLDVDLYNRCSDTGSKFATHRGYEIVALDGEVFEGYGWIEFPGHWGPTVELHMDPGTVPELLWDHFWPGVVAGCNIVCLGPQWPICFPACTAAATLGVEIARDDIIDALYPGGLVSNGPTSPGIKGSWDYPSDPEE